MLTAAAFVPGAPLIVPALAGPGATDVIEFRTAVLQVAGRLAESAQRWIAVGVGDPDTADVARGTFAGFGVDERVSLHPDGSSPCGSSPDASNPEAPMSTPMLVAGWIRGRVAPSVTVRPTLVDASTSPRDCARIGATIGRSIADVAEAVGVLVVADGSFGLTPGAPGGAIEGAGDLQTRVDAAISDGDLRAIEALAPGECADMGIAGRAAWQVAAAIWQTAAEAVAPDAESIYCAAPFGVGYQVAWWSR